MLCGVGNPSARTDRGERMLYNLGCEFSVAFVSGYFWASPLSASRKCLSASFLDIDLLVLEGNERAFCFIYFHGSVEFYRL